MTREEAIKWLNYHINITDYEETDELYIALKMAIKALEQESKTWSLDDAREDFMSDVYDTLDFLPTNDEANRIIDSFDRVTSGIKKESKTGYWIDTGSSQECSECREIQYGYDNFRHFCANCGAKMVEPPESEV